MTLAFFIFFLANLCQERRWIMSYRRITDGVSSNNLVKNLYSEYAQIAQIIESTHDGTTDFNELVEPGTSFYYQGSATNENQPTFTEGTTTRGFGLYVMHSGRAYVFQLCLHMNEMFIRYYNGDAKTFTKWEQIMREGNINSFIKSYLDANGYKPSQDQE